MNGTPAAEAKTQERADSWGKCSAMAFAPSAPMKGKSTRAPVLIGDRVEYVRADAAGKAANETSEKARAEIGALWTAVKGVIGNE